MDAICKDSVDCVNNIQKQMIVIVLMLAGFSMMEIGIPMILRKSMNFLGNTYSKMVKAKELSEEEKLMIQLNSSENDLSKIPFENMEKE